MSYNFGNAYKITDSIFKKQFWDVNGRMSRSDWCHFYSIFFLITLVFAVVAAIVPATAMGGNIISLIFLAPTLSASIRRVHDQGKAWWFSLIPFYNIYLLFFVAGDSGSNEFGEDPLGGGAAEVFS